MDSLLGIMFTSVELLAESPLYKKSKVYIIYNVTKFKKFKFTYNATFLLFAKRKLFF